MNRMLFAFLALAGSGLGLIATPAKSEEASWGCQILLCAASQNPSWHGVGYCIPPMTRLISAMKKPGFSWPVCHEANADKPGHEAFDECPAGTTIGYGAQGENGWQGEPDQCIKTVNLCQSLGGRDTSTWRRGSSSDAFYGDSNSCIQQSGTPRPRRADPYFVDIPNDQGVKQRFWFNLNY
ncbi:hypothetical protein HNQ72_005503 [Rhizobium wenxiniae]|uniref:DUF3551 domain-containing protein n=2 Tax=Rhizobium wenxiniae TaxID=1737357 RepID=A0A7X0D2I9_9HYPH|nr:hypothetical protein [Rhizobium wenxiniae]